MKLPHTPLYHTPNLNMGLYFENKKDLDLFKYMSKCKQYSYEEDENYQLFACHSLKCFIHAKIIISYFVWQINNPCFK